MNIRKVKGRLALQVSLLLVGGVFWNSSNAAGPSSPITTQPIPNLPIGVLVCPDSCSKGTASSKEYKTNFGPLPTGQYQVNGLVPGKYEAGAKGFSMKLYTVGKDGILTGQLGTAVPPISPAINSGFSTAKIKFLGRDKNVYDSPRDCQEKAGPCSAISDL